MIKYFLVFIPLFLGTSCKEDESFHCCACDQETYGSNLEIGSNSLNFLVLGDFGVYGSENQLRVADQMTVVAKKMNIEFIATVGDNFQAGGVKSISDAKWNKSFENVYKDTSLMIDWYPSLGNHDYEGNVQAQIEYSNISRRWNLPNRYYNIDKVGPDGTTLSMFFIDTTPLIKQYYVTPERYTDMVWQNTEEQLIWLDNVLEASNADWKLVFGHHPAYAAVQNHDINKNIIRSIVPIFQKHHVDAYFSGHRHNLQYSKPPGLTHYFVSGGGALTDAVAPADDLYFCRESLGFMVASITKESLKVQVINDNGLILFKKESEKFRK